LAGSSVVAGLVCTWLAQVVSLDKKEHKDLEDKSEKYRIQSKESIVGYISFLVFQIKLNIGWYSMKNEIYTIIYLLFWFAVGVVYGMVKDQITILFTTTINLLTLKKISFLVS
jgi:hypothetical protein